MDHNKLENSERDGNQTTLPASWQTGMQVKKQQLETDIDNGQVQNWKMSTSRQYILTLLI